MNPLPTVAIKRPLVDLHFAQFALDISEDEVLLLIQDGRLPVVFDLKRQCARFPMYRILATCLTDYIAGIQREHNVATMRAAIESLFPLPFDPSASRIAKKFTCGNSHVTTLIRDKTLIWAGGEWRHGPNGSPKVKRASLFKFLLDRLVCSPAFAVEIPKSQFRGTGAKNPR